MNPNGNVVPGENRHFHTMTTRAFVLSLLFFVSSLAFAQFSVSWSTIDGGGGTSTNGQYSVTGTIGQPDAQPTMSGGSFSINGGFWGFVSVVQTPGAPMLSIMHAQTNSVVVYWSSPSPGWQLQENATSVSSANWSNVNSVPYDDGTNKAIAIHPPIGKRFYRLFKP